jgi:hypothetical protein
MRLAAICKFKHFILYPDLANKFLFMSHMVIIPPENFHVHLTYTFSPQRAHNYLALKALMMLSSVCPKKCQTSSRLIIIKYTKTRVHSHIYVPLNLMEARIYYIFV